MKALIIADIQYDFLPNGTLAVPQADAIIPVLNKLKQYFELVVALQDWHPANHKSFASNHAGKKPFDIIDLHGLQQKLWPDHCVQGTAGAAFSDKLTMNKVEAIFRKGMDPEVDSYSGFYDNGHRKSTGLAGYLREKKVDEVYLTGLAGDFCVFFSAIDSLNERFSTFIVVDAVRSISPEDFKKAIQHFASKGGRIVQSGEFKTAVTH